MKTKPKYIIIKNDIKELIEKEEFLTGNKIPSEADLRTQYNVSRHTVREAISELVNEGYLYKQQGAGTFVSDEYKTKLSSVKRKKIGVITTYLSDYIFPSIIRGIEEELFNHNYSLLLSSTRNNVDNERINLDNMLEQDVDGLIIEPTKSNLLNPNLNYYLDIMEKELPVVMINASYEELVLPKITIDDVRAGLIATEHLIEEGHKKIGLITKTDDTQGKNRLKGYLKGLYNAGLSFNSEHVIRFDTESKPYISNKIKSLLQSDDLPTAFVAYNDEIAVSLLKEIYSIGKTCPEDFSVVSHDDSFYSDSFPSIKLTSIKHPKEGLGKAAARWIIEAIEDKEPKKESIIFEPELAIGNSTKSLN